MKLSTFLLVLLDTSVALAAPRPRGLYRSVGKKSVQKVSAEVNQAVATNTSEVDYSTNWSGAVLVGTGYTSVTGTMVVPSIPSSKSRTETVGSAWVGIDGDTCDSLWQTGISWTVSGGRVTYDAWYEWVPYSASVSFTGITISAGDTITMTVTSTSTTSGKATIENVSTGKTVSHTYSSMSSSYALCNVNAEWIVEDYAECTNSDCSSYELLPFADYGTVEFTDCSAVQSGKTVGVTGATLIDMITESGNDIESECTDTSSTVTCKYE